jgi:hypothetical protein
MKLLTTVILCASLPSHQTPITMPLTKARQQDIVAQFVYAKDLELCMYIYLDTFLDTHRKNNPRVVEGWKRRDVLAALEVSYKYIREKAIAFGMLTEEAAGEYLLGNLK